METYLTTSDKQLCPSNDCYRLTTEKNLGVSMFERLINNGAPCVTLTHQRRMHPELTPVHSWVYGEGKIVDGVKSNDRGIKVFFIYLVF